MDESTTPRSTSATARNPMLGELADPFLATLGIVLYGAAVVVLVTYYARPDLRPTLAPTVSGAYVPLVLIGYVVVIKGLAVRRARRAHNTPHR